MSCLLGVVLVFVYLSMLRFPGSWSGFFSPPEFESDLLFYLVLEVVHLVGGPGASGSLFSGARGPGVIDGWSVHVEVLQHNLFL